MTKRILVSLATGKQGAAVVRALSKRNEVNPDTYYIVAVTHNTSSPKAVALGRLPGVHVIESNYIPSEMFENAAGGQGSQHGAIYGVFSVQQSYDNPRGGVTAEINEAKQMADEAAKHSVQHFIYASSDFGTVRDTGVAHFESKRQVEEYFKLSHPRLPTTVLRPVMFMENITNGETLIKKLGNTGMIACLHKGTQLIATSDIGEFAAIAFDDPIEYIGKTLSLAGDTQDGFSLAAIYRSVKGCQLPVSFASLGKLGILASTPLRTMFHFFNKDGYNADIAALKSIHPGLMDFETYVKAEL
jgi:uncharacterized protein YbjT (DUF2867 family)